MEVFMYVAYLDQANALFLYFVVRIRRRRKKFTFAISSADEFLVCFSYAHAQPPLFFNVNFYTATTI